jgi:hypothetical protein
MEVSPHSELQTHFSSRSPRTSNLCCQTTGLVQACKKTQWCRACRRSFFFGGRRDFFKKIATKKKTSRIEKCWFLTFFGLTCFFAENKN